MRRQEHKQTAAEGSDKRVQRVFVRTFAACLGDLTRKCYACERFSAGMSNRWSANRKVIIVPIEPARIRTICIFILFNNKHGIGEGPF